MLMKLIMHSTSIWSTTLAHSSGLTKPWNRKHFLVSVDVPLLIKFSIQLFFSWVFYFFSNRKRFDIEFSWCINSFPDTFQKSVFETHFPPEINSPNHSIHIQRFVDEINKKKGRFGASRENTKKPSEKIAQTQSSRIWFRQSIDRLCVCIFLPQVQECTKSDNLYYW